MWKKLVLRGSTRNAKGQEELAYFKGGFGRLAEAMVSSIKANGGDVEFNSKVVDIEIGTKNTVNFLITNKGNVEGSQYLFTPSFPIIANIFTKAADVSWLSSLRRVRYLGNMCLVLRLKQSLSDTYWLNVNDPGFPFVGVIEHTNFDSPENYEGTHIVFLSRYLAVEDPVWLYTDKQYLKFALDKLKEMFPKIDSSWVIDYRVWRSEHAQPVTEKNYSKYVPGYETPFNNAFISTMAQIYPEDRGTNYAIREGRAAADDLSKRLANPI
jgi:protoporphyrinogen oxidase